jgi:hypothetical protein
MRTFVAAGVALVLAASAVACDGDRDERSYEAAAPPNVAGQATATAAAPNDSGSTALRKALAAMETDDVEALEALVVYATYPCAAAMGSGGPPPCRPGEEEGTVVEAAPFASCEGEWMRRDEARATLRRFAGSAGYLYAAYEAAPAMYPRGEYALIFASDASAGRASGLELVLTDQGITGLNFGCGQTPPQLAQLQGLSQPLDLGA